MFSVTNSPTRLICKHLKVATWMELFQDH
jgi:hypothetical protein